jgi:hypothetical protein
VKLKYKEQKIDFGSGLHKLFFFPIGRKEDGNSQTAWNSENGMMLSASASTREEALALSNKLMREFLKPNGEPLH